MNIYQQIAEVFMLYHNISDVVLNDLYYSFLTLQIHTHTPRGKLVASPRSRFTIQYTKEFMFNHIIDGFKIFALINKDVYSIINNKIKTEEFLKKIFGQFIIYYPIINIFEKCKKTLIKQNEVRKLILDVPNEYMERISMCINSNLPAVMDKINTNYGHRGGRKSRWYRKSRRYRKSRKNKKYIKK